MKLTDKLIELVGWDKVLHFAIGFAIACAFALILVDKCGETAVQGATSGVFVATMAGFVKELLDEHGDWMDLVATITGAFTVLVGALIASFLNS